MLAARRRVRARDSNAGNVLRAKSIVVASGARYRRPEIENLDDFEGRGVWYWASPIEARLCADQEVVLVGGGNSAGQAAVFLSGHARKVYMVIRGGGLGASMSRYLIERIEATPNIELVFNTEVVGLEGDEDGSLARVRWRSRLAPRRDARIDIRNLFLFVGADPATGWLDGCGVMVDRGGFVVTGAQCRKSDGQPASAAGNLGARRVRGRRRALRLGQARRRRDRRGRAGGGGAARLSRRCRETGAVVARNAILPAHRHKGKTPWPISSCSTRRRRTPRLSTNIISRTTSRSPRKFRACGNTGSAKGPIATPAGPSGLHLIATLSFDSMAAIAAAFASPEGQATAADVPKFASGGVEMHFSETGEV